MRKSAALVAVAVVTAAVLIGLLANRQIVAQGPAALRPVPRWEYKTMRLNLETEEKGQGALNSMGEEGWELCAAVQPKQFDPFVILKRPITIGRRGDR